MNSFGTPEIPSDKMIKDMLAQLRSTMSPAQIEKLAVEMYSDPYYRPWSFVLLAINLTVNDKSIATSDEHRTVVAKIAARSDVFALAFQIMRTKFAAHPDADTLASHAITVNKLKHSPKLNDRKLCAELAVGLMTAARRSN